MDGVGETEKLKVPALACPTHHVSDQFPTSLAPMLPVSEKFPALSVDPIVFRLVAPLNVPSAKTGVFGAPPVIRICQESPG